MDIFGPLSFVTDLVSKVIGRTSNRPRLGVRIISFRPDPAAKRWVFRASVLNYGRIGAVGCEGFWSLFDPALREVSSGTGVFWAPAADNDYDFENRNSKSTTIGFNERRFCWAELDVTPEPIEKTNIRLFPYDSAHGLYTFALVIEYGQYKSFDFVGLNVPKSINASTPLDQVAEKIDLQWKHRCGLRGQRRFLRLRTFIAQQDYHNYVRPT